MKTVKEIILENRWFLYPYTTLFSFSLIVLAFLPKNEIQLKINQLNNPIFDEVFKFSTSFAEGISITIVILLSAIIKLRWGLLTSLALIYNTIVVFILKRFVFSTVERPKVYFSSLSDWHTVEGVNLHTHLSFPSGHTAAAFCLFFSLSIALKNKKQGALLFFLSFLVGYSRIYLSQHYLRDVVAGSIIGILMVLLAFLTLQKFNFINQKTWLNKGLFGFS